MNVLCPHCGMQNRSTASFCARCGGKLVSGRGGAPAGGAWQRLQRFWQQARLHWARLWGQTRAEALGWYGDLIARRPAFEGQIASAPAPVAVTQTVQFFPLLLPAASQSTQLEGLSFGAAPAGGGPGRTVLMVGPRQGERLQQGDKVRAWGVWDTGSGSLHAWRVEVWERDGWPANYVVSTPRRPPLAAVVVALVGFMLLCFMCSLLAG